MKSTLTWSKKLKSNRMPMKNKKEKQSEGQNAITKMKLITGNRLNNSKES